MSGRAKTASLSLKWSLMGAWLVGLTSCVPALKSSPERGPTVVDIVNHINCELATIVNRRNNERLKEWILNAPPTMNLSEKLNYLSTYHFVASALVTLDALDSEALAPSLNFINPYNMMGSLNGTWSVGGNLSGSQERNISFGYSVDLAELSDFDEKHFRKTVKDKDGNSLPKKSSVEKYCVGPVGVPDKDSGALTGDLGLTDIVVDGLIGLDASKDVNLYGNSGPNPLTISQDMPSDDTKISLSDAVKNMNGLIVSSGKLLSAEKQKEIKALTNGTPSEAQLLEAKGLLWPEVLERYQSTSPKTLKLIVEGKVPALHFGDTNVGEIGTLYFYGNISFSPSTIDPMAPGTVTLTGKAVTIDMSTRYFVSLSGTTIQQKQKGNITFALSGTMSKLAGLAAGDTWSALGSNPKLNLAGDIKYTYDTNSLSLIGTVTPDPGGTETPVKMASVLAIGQPRVHSSAGPGSGGTSGSAKNSTAGAAGGSSLFSSLVSFIISYGVNGGPNWTLAKFKGPTGSSSLASLNRQDTDTLTITFVPACKDAKNTNPTPTNFWDSLPHCDSWTKSNAVSAGFANNTLIQAGRGL